MEIYVLNNIIDKWRKYNNLKQPFDTLNMKREVLAGQLGLRESDVEQHLVNTLQERGNAGHYDYARETICEVVKQCKDNDAICDIYRSLFNILHDHKDKAKDEILALQVTDKVADVDETIQRLTAEASAFRNEVIAHREHIEKLKNRTWWQRLLNKDV